MKEFEDAYAQKRKDKMKAQIAVNEEFGLAQQHRGGYEGGTKNKKSDIVSKQSQSEHGFAQQDDVVDRSPPAMDVNNNAEQQQENQEQFQEEEKPAVFNR